MNYRINTPKVIHQVFESEVVIVNLETGIYYSVRGSGIDLWQAIEAGVAAEALNQQFNGTTEPDKIAAFIAQLESEQLIQRTEDRPADQIATAVPPKPFVEPVFEKFTDMREMLLIDPIHELDESGWPKRSRPREEK